MPPHCRRIQLRKATRRLPHRRELPPEHPPSRLAPLARRQTPPPHPNGSRRPGSRRPGSRRPGNQRPTQLRPISLRVPAPLPQSHRQRSLRRGNLLRRSPVHQRLLQRRLLLQRLLRRSRRQQRLLRRSRQQQSPRRRSPRRRSTPDPRRLLCRSPRRQNHERLPNRALRSSHARRSRL
jgi:hypothetical protein